jgi:hypothetical protein
LKSYAPTLICYHLIDGDEIGYYWWLPSCSQQNNYGTPCPKKKASSHNASTVGFVMSDLFTSFIKGLPPVSDTAPPPLAPNSSHGADHHYHHSHSHSHSHSRRRSHALEWPEYHTDGERAFMEVALNSTPRTQYWGDMCMFWDSYRKRGQGQFTRFQSFAQC